MSEKVSDEWHTRRDARRRIFRFVSKWVEKILLVDVCVWVAKRSLSPFSQLDPRAETLREEQ